MIVSFLTMALITVPASDIATRCRDLEALSRWYAGQVLSPVQQQVKQQMIVWYLQNCKKKRG